MARRTRPNLGKHNTHKPRPDAGQRQNKTILRALLEWLIPADTLFTKDRFHGNANWTPAQLVRQAVLWSWQEAGNVTDAFAVTAEICQELGMEEVARSYTTFMDALTRYPTVLGPRLDQRCRRLAEEVGGRFWRDDDWVLLGFDGSRVSTPRTIANETEFCAANYGQGKTAKYRKKKTSGMRRRKNERNPAQPQGPQVWITMLWHMGLRLPWTWRLGPSNSSERAHVVEMLQQEEFPEDTLFCGDAGFVGYPLWKAIRVARGDFLVRVGGNVKLLSAHADVAAPKEGKVLCWPKGQMHAGVPPLELRLVKIRIGRTRMWILTSVLDEKRLPKKKIVKYYKMRWGVEVEYRGLKQTIDRGHLRCRNSDRVYVELDWSIRGMAVAELLALREQIVHPRPGRQQIQSDYDPKDRSLANTVRALRRCMRHLGKLADSDDDLLCQLACALVQKYHNRTDKKARYRPKNPDKKPLGEPIVTSLTREQRERLRKFNQRAAA